MTTCLNPSFPPRLSSDLWMLGDYPRHRGGDLLAHRVVQELVGPVRVGMRTEHAGDHELRAGELLAEHAHERDRAAFAHVHRRPAVELLAGRVDGLLTIGRANV